VQIVANFDQSISTLPTGFVAAINYVVSYFDALFTNDVTVTINVGYGEVNGQAMSANALGESLPAFDGNAGYIPFESYSSVRNALVAQSAPGSATLPTSAPAGAPANLATTQAEAKALGLLANNGSLDGNVGFSSAPNIFSYAPNVTPPSNEYYFVGVVEHEFSEIMGRDSFLDLSNAYSPMDLYRYSAPGVRQFTTAASSYFSVNGGQSNLDSWNNFQTGNSGDLGDWAPSAGNDAVDDNSNPGVINAFTATDITLMNALGWTSQSTTSQAPATGQALFGALTHDVTSPGGEIYALYETILGRAPDALGLEWFAAALNSGTPVTDIARTLLGSSEYTTEHGPFASSSDSSFVNQLYLEALHRPAEAAGLAFWDNALENDTSRAQVAADIALSPESQNDLAPIFTSNAGVFVPSQTDAEIARLYYAVLDRAPDTSGLRTFESAFAMGTPLTSIANAFIGSAEYASDFGSPSNAQCVTALYEGALGRAPDATGEQSWVNALNQGTSRATVAIDIAESPEAASHLLPQIETGFKLA
jgi:hypothetical protein